jgi:hypothetical protein
MPIDNLINTRADIKNKLKEQIKTMSEEEKWNNLFIINPNSQAHFQFDK